MGSGASIAHQQAKKAADKTLKNRRYLKGKKPEKYFEDIIKVEMGDILLTLQILDEEAFIIFQQFIIIDADNSGEVSLEEFHEYLQITQSKFTERVFTMLDMDASGLLDFKEFCVGVWNYCTYDTKLAAKLIFDLFDVDKLGKLTMAEYDSLLRMIYNVETADPELMSILAIHGDDEDAEVSWAEFLQLTEEHYQILQPAFEVQRIMRKKLLSVKYWEKKSKLRREMFQAYDMGDLPAWEAIQAITSIKAKERADELERQKEEVEAARAEEAKQLIDDARARMEEDQKRRVHVLEELKSSKLDLELREEEAWEALRVCREALDKPFLVDQLEAFGEAKVAMWEAYADATAKSWAAAKAREERDVSVAGQDDAVHKTEAWLKTKHGRQKFESMVQQRYMVIMHKSLSDGSVLSRTLLAGMFDVAGGKTASTPAKLAFKKHPNKNMAEQAKKEAKEAVLERYAAQEIRKVKDKFESEAKARQRDFEALARELEDKHRPKESKWVVLWDEDERQSVMINRETGERAGASDEMPAGTAAEVTAVCEECDNVIPEDDARCFECNTERSRKNLGIFEDHREQQLNAL